MQNTQDQLLDIADVADIRHFMASMRSEVTKCGRVYHPEYMAFFESSKKFETEIAYYTKLLRDYDELLKQLRYTDMRSMFSLLEMQQLKLRQSAEELRGIRDRIIDARPESSGCILIFSMMTANLVVIIPCCITGWPSAWTPLVDDGYAYVINTPFFVVLLAMFVVTATIYFISASVAHERTLKKWTRS